MSSESNYIIRPTVVLGSIVAGTTATITLLSAFDVRLSAWMSTNWQLAWVLAGCCFASTSVLAFGRINSYRIGRRKKVEAAFNQKIRLLTLENEALEEQARQARDAGRGREVQLELTPLHRDYRDQPGEYISTVSNYSFFDISDIQIKSLTPGIHAHQTRNTLRASQERYIDERADLDADMMIIDVKVADKTITTWKAELRFSYSVPTVIVQSLKLA
jgi:hypothetical protein